MNKQKTRKSLSKRTHVSGTGKLLRSQMASQHLARRKSPRARTNAYNTTVVSAGDAKLMKHFLPNI